MSAPKRIRKSDELNVQEEQAKLILTNLYNLRDDEKMEKVVLKCKDGRVLANKSGLVSGSDYFRAMFSHTNIESETNTVSFLDTSVEVMNIIVKFIFAKDIPTRPEITDASIRETIVAADKMQLNGLFDKYWNLYTTEITLDNFFNVWQLAEVFNVDETIQSIRLFVLNHMKQISKIDTFSDITITQLENLIAHNVNTLLPSKIGEFITFLLTWGTKGSAENRIDGVVNLIQKCNIKILPDYVLRSFMTSNPVVVSSPSIYNVLSKEIISRWLTVTKPEIGIYAFIIESENCTYSVNYLTANVWCPMPKQFRVEGWFPAVSKREAVFFFKFCQLGFSAYDLASMSQYNQLEQLTLYDSITSETADRNEIFFKRTNTSYACFNFKQKEWRTIHFDGKINNCRSMLLSTSDGRYLFDLDERRIKIVDTSLGTCVTKEKLEGNWQSIKCKSLDTALARKLIFFQKFPNSSLLVYDIECDSWTIVPFPNIKSDVVMYVSYDDDCLIFEKTDVKYNVYSLKTMMKVTEYIIPFLFNGRIHFDVSIVLPRKNAGSENLINAPAFGTAG